jgi:hypothetical protein
MIEAIILIAKKLPKLLFSFFYKKYRQPLTLLTALPNVYALKFSKNDSWPSRLCFRAFVKEPGNRIEELKATKELKSNLHENVPIPRPRSGRNLPIASVNANDINGRFRPVACVVLIYSNDCEGQPFDMALTKNASFFLVMKVIYLANTGNFR